MPTRLATGWKNYARRDRLGWRSSRAVVPPRPRPGATGDIEGGGTGSPERSGAGAGEVDLERGTAVCAGALRLLAQQLYLPELPAPAWVCVEAAQETTVQG
jgi:hypothetical protein